MGLQWEARYAIDVPEIDKQHEEIFRQVGVLLTAMKSGKVGDELAQLVDFLEQYVVHHFEAEERLMARHGWPQLVAHHSVHQAFIMEFQRFKQEFRAGGSSTSLVVRLSTFVTSWLSSHIAGADRAFGRSLNTRTRPIAG